MVRSSVAALSTGLVLFSGCASSDATSASGTAATTPTTKTSSATTSSATSATTTTTPTASSSAPVSPDAPYACEKDADCYVSCKHGAVNRAWYDAAKLSECKDGCQMGTDKVKCEDKVCVAYSGTKRVDGCTKRPIQTKD